VGFGAEGVAGLRFFSLLLNLRFVKAQIAHLRVIKHAGGRPVKQ
jgi:hypothetical protein